MRRAETCGEWARRARPLLGTLVEVGLPAWDVERGLADHAFATIVEVQACLSRFDPASDVACFASMPAGATLQVRAPTVEVLGAARELEEASDGIFDITMGSGPRAWRLSGDALHKSSDAVRFDLDGIGKGHAVDRAVRVLIAAGCRAGWVNAGGDLRAFGAIDLPVMLRDEECGGARLFARISEGAFATSCFGPSTRSRAFDAHSLAPVQGHASVAAPSCLWADALTKVVAITKKAAHPLLARYGARAWLH
ncbi:MAG: FAD:protein FMN transferase [Gammaproteobacteria bacterium]